MTSPHVVAEEALPDGRTLLEYDDGSIAVTGLSQRPAEAARIGYTARPSARAAAQAPAPIYGAPEDPWAVADRLLLSLLDEQQRRDRRRHGRWWVEADRGWLQMGGSPHDIRFRPSDAPGVEWSLCVVPADRTLPPGDVWSTLLLTATTKPDVFFRVANRTVPLSPTPPPALP